MSTPAQNLERPMSFDELVDYVGRQYQIPAGLRHGLFKRESGNNPNIHPSSQGALGPGQLMPGTARQMGVNPSDPIENVVGSMHYLRSIYDGARRNSADDSEAWAKAVAGYFSGPGNIGTRPGQVFIEDKADGDGTRTSQYVEGVLSNWASYGGVDNDWASTVPTRDRGPNTYTSRHIPVISEDVKGRRKRGKNTEPQVSNPDVDLSTLPVYDASTGRVLPSQREQTAQTAQALGGMVGQAGAEAADPFARIGGQGNRAYIKPTQAEERARGEEMRREQARIESTLTDADRQEIQEKAKAGAAADWASRSFLNPLFTSIATGGEDALAGLIGVAEDLTNPPGLRQKYRESGANPNVVSDYFKKRSYITRAAVEQADQIHPMSGVQTALSAGGELIGNVAVMSAAAELGGADAAFSVLPAAQARGRGASATEAGFEAVKGQAYKNLFGAMENVPLPKRAAAMFAGTYGIEKATGATDEQALKSAATNAGFVTLPEAAGRVARYARSIVKPGESTVPTRESSDRARLEQRADAFESTVPVRPQTWEQRVEGLDVPVRTIGGIRVVKHYSNFQPRAEDGTFVEGKPNLPESTVPQRGETYAGEEQIQSERGQANQAYRQVGGEAGGVEEGGRTQSIRQSPEPEKGQVADRRTGIAKQKDLEVVPGSTPGVSHVGTLKVGDKWDAGYAYDALPMQRVSDLPEGESRVIGIEPTGHVVVGRGDATSKVKVADVVGQSSETDWLDYSPEEREEIGREVERQKRARRGEVGGLERQSVEARQAEAEQPGAGAKVLPESETGTGNEEVGIRTARASYEALRNNQTPLLRPIYLDSEGASSVFGKLADPNTYLRQVKHTQGTFLLFTADGKTGYIFPNPDLSYQRAALSEVYPGMTEADFSDKLRLNPARAELAGDGRWKIGQVSGKTVPPEVLKDYPDLVGGTPVKGEEGAEDESPTSDTPASVRGGRVTLYQGRGVHNQGTPYYSPDKEWALQFTQSGRESEVSKRSVPAERIFRATELPFAGSDEELERGMAEARAKGYGALWLDEGNGQPASVMIFDEAALKKTPRPSTTRAETTPTVPTREEVLARLETEKSSKRTGLKPSQAEYLAGEVRAAKDSLPAPNHPGERKTIDVPGDGEFELFSQKGADRLHSQLTGKSVDEYLNAQDELPAKPYKPAEGDEVFIKPDRYSRSYRGEVESVRGGKVAVRVGEETEVHSPTKLSSVAELRTGYEQQARDATPEQLESVVNNIAEKRDKGKATVQDDVALEVVNAEMARRAQVSGGSSATEPSVVGGEISGGGPPESSVPTRGQRFGPGAANVGDVPVESQIKQLTQAVQRVTKPQQSLTDRFQVAQDLADRASSTRDAFTRGLMRVKATSSALYDGLTKLPEFTDFKRTLGEWLGANQKADYELMQFVKAANKQVPNPIRQEAITNYIQAGGDEAVLRERADASQGKLRRGYEAALTLTPEEKLIATNISSYLDSRLQEGIDAGLLDHGIDNYITQVWKKPNPVTQRLQADIQIGKLPVNFRYARQRLFDSYFEGEQAGYIPASKKFSDLIAAYDQSFNRALSARAFIKSLTQGEASDGRPNVTVSGVGSTLPDASAPEAVLIRPRSKVPIQPSKAEQEINPDVESVDVSDYRTIDHPALRKWKWVQSVDGTPVMLQGDLLVHPEVYKHLNNVLKASALRKNPVGKFVLGAQSTIKQTMLSVSGFHQVQEAVHAIGHRINPAGARPLDFDNPAQMELVNHGLQVADYNAQSLFSEGLASGNLTNAIPILGKRILKPYTEYLFHDYIPRLKMETALHIVDRNTERYKAELETGTVSRDQIVELSARQANAAYGELNYKYMGRNPTTQDVFRLGLLAPDFLEARGKFVGQALKPHGREQLVALGTLAVTQFIGARILNKIFDDDWHWDRPFSFVLKGHEYTLRSVPEDIYRLISDTRPFFYNRMSPAVRTATEAMTGRDERGIKRDLEEQVKDLLTLPMPISLRRKGDDAWWEPVLNSFGVQEKKYRTKAEEMMGQILGDKMGQPPTGDTLERLTTKRSLIKSLREGGKSVADIQPEMDKALKAGTLKLSDVPDILKGQLHTQFEDRFKQLGIEDAIKVYEVMTPEERKQTEDELMRKRPLLLQMPEEKRKALEARIDALTKP